MFQAPKVSLGNLDAETAAMLIAAVADIAVIVDYDGVVKDVAFHSEELAGELAGHALWLGRPWTEAVTKESRPKIDMLLRDATSNAATKWRHLNYPAVVGADIPILFSAIQLCDGDAGRVIAFGRDERPLSVLQQRLINAQQSMEQDYFRFRNIETRYRLLFQTASDAVLILDAGTSRLVEANPAARKLLGEPRRKAAGEAGIGRLADIFGPEGLSSVQALLANVRASGRPDDVRARLMPGDRPGGREVLVAASLLREADDAFFLVRLSPLGADPATAVVSKLKFKLLKLVESAPDGFVITGRDGRILSANAAFLDMAQLGSEAAAAGEPLSQWVGRPGLDLEVLIANLQHRGSVRLFATTLRGAYGAPAAIEISAVSVMNGGQPCFGFAIRNIDRRLTDEPMAADTRPRSIEQLTRLIGRVALKDLVRESTDLIERLCIETALEMTGDNRASAAEMLGLSRQSLYVKLRRYGLGDLAVEGGH